MHSAKFYKSFYITFRNCLGTTVALVYDKSGIQNYFSGYYSISTIASL